MPRLLSALLATAAILIGAGCYDRLTVTQAINGGTYGQVNAVAYDSGGAAGGFNEIEAVVTCRGPWGLVQHVAAYWTSLKTGAGKVGDVSYQSYANCSPSESLVSVGWRTRLS